jgi:hypothetical protein
MYTRLVRLCRSFNAPYDRLANPSSRRFNLLTSTDASEVIVGLGCELDLGVKEWR